MKTYRQKIEEMRLKSLQIIEDGLNNENETTRFIHAFYFINMMPDAALDSEIPESTGKAFDNERGAEVLIDSKEKTQ